MGALCPRRVEDQSGSGRELGCLLRSIDRSWGSLQGLVGRQAKNRNFDFVTGDVGR